MQARFEQQLNISDDVANTENDVSASNEDDVEGGDDSSKWNNSLRPRKS